MPEHRARLVIGAGYLGRRLAEFWATSGHRVFAVTRCAEKARALQQVGVQPVVIDLLDADAAVRLAACDPLDIVVWSVAPDRGRRMPAPANASLVDGAARAAVFADGERRAFFERALRPVCAALAERADRWLHVSSTSVYGQHGGEWVDENSPAQPRSEAGQVQLWAEQMVCETLGASRAAVLRLAGLYGPGRLLRRIESLRAGEPIPGRPDAWLNLIHVDDAVSAIDAVASSAYSGTLLVCDDEPVRRRDYFQYLAAATGAPPAVFDATRDTERVRGLGKRCCNRRLRAELGVTLRYPSYREGLGHALSPERRG